MKYGKYLYAYKVKYYDDEYKLVKQFGVTYGDTFADAADNVCKYYGEESIEKMRLICIDEGWSVIQLPHDVVKMMIERGAEYD